MARARTVARSDRDTRVDMLRGIALISMFVAHVAPSQGPAGILEYSEFATAPLFALLIGMGGQLSSRGVRGIVGAFVRAGIRGVVLVALGLWLETLGAQIDIVLVYLALPVVLAPFLALLPDLGVFAVGAAAWAATPVAYSHFGADKMQAAIRHDQLGVRLWDSVATGHNYRLIELLVHVCAGILIARWYQRGASQAHMGLAGGALLFVVGALSLLNKTGRVDIVAYQPDRMVTFFCLALVAGFALLWLAVIPASWSIPPLSVAGAMTLTVYALQIIYLAWYVKYYMPGHPDDSWANLAVLIIGGLVFPMLWQRLVRSSPWNKGPIEGPTALITNIFR